ncbi:MAG: DegT/DnrJ/EryC1/StrS family aminotransferase [Gammaproteobacteria bacterium]|nr:DegT/DnrJ/EryC1/StrS family aminotransferase [Gammaproteobacteria bacterium]MBU2677218.1 DegT/DnrJ/EryC1/StrS family aminotransferase [Gammaproteobacteria bacterium]NNL50949.1 DegT/DnrJ/EryC1/StrS family aminotransferase [Woeseiaceae bacterium]
MSKEPIPLVDLRAQYHAIKPEMDAAINEVLEETAFIGGRRVAEFAQEFAELIGVEHCVPVANGTDAIFITLKMLGIGSGDEVVTVANSWISTSETISQTGARPVFVDIDEYFHIDVTKLEAAINERTKAIIPVHLYGQPADMATVCEVAERHDLKVIEDSAQAHLAQFDGRMVATFAEAGTFSFYPGKNLGAYGDAGAIVTNDAALAEKCKMYANHGALVKHQHVMEGINSRLDGLQAAVLRTKLPHLRGWTEARQSIAGKFDQRLQSIEQIRIPKRRPNATHSYHLYVIRAKERDGLADHLRANGIGCAIHYPTPLPLLPAYEKFNYSHDAFAEAVAASKEILSLPIYPELPASAVERIGGCIEDFYSRT